MYCVRSVPYGRLPRQVVARAEVRSRGRGRGHAPPRLAHRRNRLLLAARELHLQLDAARVVCRLW